jgi:hypothetical protein
VTRERALIPPVRRSVPLLVAVFVAGLGLGAVAIAISSHRGVHHVVITRTVVDSSPAAQASRTVTGSSATISGSTPTSGSAAKRTTATVGSKSLGFTAALILVAAVLLATRSRQV